MKAIHRRAVGGLIALTALAGCGSEASAPSGPQQAHDYESPAQVQQSIELSLERLRGLEVVEVRGLVVDLPAEAGACYGLCKEWEEEYQAEQARQAPRVARLAALAEEVASDASLVPRTWSEADAALEALAGLEIVEVTGLVEVKPVNNPQCYNQPCAEDVAEAERLNGVRVAQVFAVVDAAKKAGL